MNKYLIVCLSTSTFYVSTLCMEDDYYGPVPPQPYPRHTVLRRVCTYTIIPITILASTATVSILVYKWLNPIVDQTEEDTQKINILIDQASSLLPQIQQVLSQGNNLLELINPMIPRIDQFLSQAESLYPHTQQLLTQGNSLLQQLNAMAPRADQLLCDAENLYPQIELAVSSFLNITERLGQLFGK